ncbi:MAG: ribosome maturation factor RimM [Acidimicrobiia bacterium]|nr:ribosome maturation factor RimM [Acidimicrobiia bacterium]
MKRVYAPALNSSTDLTIGRIGRAHGIRGEVAVRVYADDPRLFEPGSAMRSGEKELVVAHSRPHKNTLLVAFDGITTRTEAETLLGLELTVPIEARRELEDGEFWPDDLIGLAVHADAGKVGEVVDVVAGEAQDRLVVGLLTGGTVEIPFVDELVPEVLPEEGLIRITPIEGLF